MSWLAAICFEYNYNLYHNYIQSISIWKTLKKFNKQKTRAFSRDVNILTDLVKMINKLFTLNLDEKTLYSEIILIN